MNFCQNKIKSVCKKKVRKIQENRNSYRNLLNILFLFLGTFQIKQKKDQNAIFSIRRLFLGRSGLPIRSRDLVGVGSGRISESDQPVKTIRQLHSVVGKEIGRIR